MGKFGITDFIVDFIIGDFTGVLSQGIEKGRRSVRKPIEFRRVIEVQLAGHRIIGNRRNRAILILLLIGVGNLYFIKSNRSGFDIAGEGIAIIAEVIFFRGRLIRRGDFKMNLSVVVLFRCNKADRRGNAMVLIGPIQHRVDVTGRKSIFKPLFPTGALNLFPCCAIVLFKVQY